MRYGSVCSGIEAASAAWHPLGWSAAWLAEIEPFPSAVLAHHYPDVPNLGDMTRISRRVLIGEVEAPELLVGGTPCQAFSVAGLREGLADDRGALTIKYVELADAIDFIRRRRGEPEAVVVWENVPGVLSSKDNAFGCFLGALAGEDCELQPAGKKWTNAGCVFGPSRAVAWRVLDAQYFGVAQRRRRVFVVASARKGFDPAAVLFEFDGVRRDSAPSREAQARLAGAITTGASSGGGWRIGPDEAAANHVIECFGGGRTAGSLDVAACLTSKGQRIDFEFDTFAVQPLAGTLQANGKAAGSATQQDAESGLLIPVQCVTGDITHTLKAEGFDASEDGTGRGQPIIPVLSVHGTQDPDVTVNLAHTLGRNQGQENAVVYPLLEVGKRTGASTTDQRAGMGIGDNGDPMFTLQASAQHGVALAVSENQRAEVRLTEYCWSITAGGGKPGQGYPAALVDMSVRRLTPTECERLQGFPDGYTDVPFRGKPAADGPRYKAIGNSKAVPVVQWLGRRIDDALRSRRRVAA
ncbi:hypothetical protein VI26_22940 [Chromobacterium sp. LK1]|uniref:DNA cytosine methyltransferase n=1 Tax=Chromobacterium sp. LK1 TaxID=1628193 RepID=UPI0006528B81|nr:DNA cytosine methyltransferase [Chromobacterium sp. LK1]KMN29621.1 hypothetical protein VI26_22940 [Chromobacterium sp. LK1]